MAQGFLRRLLGGGPARFARRHQGFVDAVNRHGPQWQGQPADRLAARLGELRTSAANGAKEDALRPEVFALAREAADQALGMRHFDVQLLGGLALAQGMVAEMKTGEGKTLVATLPATLAAVMGQPAHVVTVNDYLARRDAEWMGVAFQALGLTVGINTGGLSNEDKRAAYAADVTYGTNNQFGFDHLSDNMVVDAAQFRQRGLGLAVVDEVDSILIDEARTPLAISGQAADLTPLYLACDELAGKFTRGSEDAGGITADFAIDERSRQVHFSDAGYDRAEELLSAAGMMRDGGLFEAHNLNLMHHLVAALRARHLYARDRDYVVRDGQVVIVDEHTGRLMPGRRWGDGMHQAVEAKEKVRIEPESQTLAHISLQNYYRQYDRLAGMTGTALTEAEEFAHIYGLEVAEIPTHRAMVRDDQLDLVYARRDAKLRQVVADIQDCQRRGQPVLVGTTTIESSEEIAALLTAADIKHDVLNAKQHEREAEIIAEAGMPGRVTISTSMAGRGTDIVLGGHMPPADDPGHAAWRARHDTVVAAGGLRIIGTERHESRRIDNQLRGRAGRQGDPGSSVFYLSFEDPLLRVFTDQKFGKVMERLMAGDDEPLEARMVTQAIEKAQRSVEGYHSDIRKQLLEYDDIANDQRQIIYGQRRAIVTSDDVSAIAREFATAAVEAVVHARMPLEAPEEEWDAAGAAAELHKAFKADCPVPAWLEADPAMTAASACARATEVVLQALADNVARLGERSLQVQKMLVLEVIDQQWRAHLAALDHLRQGIGLRGFAQKNPKQEYRREALGMFNTMLVNIRHETTVILLNVRLREEGEGLPPARQPPVAPPQPATAVRPARPPAPPGMPPPQPDQPARTPAAKPAARPAPPKQRRQPVKADPAAPKRNDPCPCGSGKKFKHCHGRVRPPDQG